MGRHRRAAIRGSRLLQLPDLLADEPGDTALHVQDGYGTDNTYIEVLLEGGILAFAAFTLHFLSLLRTLPLLSLAVLQRRDAVVGAAMAGLIIVLVSAVVANVLLHILFFWGVAAFALACTTR